jgi:hypothetical protein
LQRSGEDNCFLLNLAKQTLSFGSKRRTLIKRIC